METLFQILGLWMETFLLDALDCPKVVLSGGQSSPMGRLQLMVFLEPLENLWENCVPLASEANGGNGGASSFG